MSTSKSWFLTIYYYGQDNYRYIVKNLKNIYKWMLVHNLMCNLYTDSEMCYPLLSV